MYRLFIALLLAVCTFISTATYASAQSYTITWKSVLREGSVGTCRIRISGQPLIGGATQLKSWDHVVLPFNAYTDKTLFDPISYSPKAGCSKLIIDASCFVKPDATEWLQKLEISPCMNRTVTLEEDGMRQY